MRSVLALVIFAAGCATPTTVMIHGRLVPRIDVAYTDGEYFALEHRGIDPRGDGPSSGLWGWGGEIRGASCNLDLDAEVEHYGRWMKITGYAYQDELFMLEVRDRLGERHITGLFGGTDRGIDLRLTPERLTGFIGLRDYDLRADHDAYVGTVTVDGERRRLTAPGVQSLWRMAAADQALLVATMLSCAARSETPEALLEAERCEEHGPVSARWGRTVEHLVPVVRFVHR